MPKKVNNLNRLRQPPKRKNQEEVRRSARVISSDTRHTALGIGVENEDDDVLFHSETSSGHNPGPSSSRGMGGMFTEPLFVAPEDPPSRKEKRGRYKLKDRDKDDCQGSFTDRLINTISQQESQYPQRVMSQTGSKKIHFSSTAKSKERSDGVRRNSVDEFDWNLPGVQESLEICQGFSKIKLEDWYPFYDFQQAKRNQSVTETETQTNTTASDGNMDKETDDEWEETLVYIDLEDVPDATSLLSSLSKSNEVGAENRRNTNDSSENASSEIKIFNMDSELPVLLIGGKYISGHWEDALGTSLYFQKKSIPDCEADSSPEAQSSSSSPTEDAPPNSSNKLKNIVKKPEIPFDPLFGENFGSKDDGYELVAKSCKVLKAKLFPVVNEDVKGEDVIRDADNEFDQKDFQIPPVSLIRQFYGKDINYENYMENDIERRRKIREKWAPEEDKEKTSALPFIKPEPVDLPDFVEDDFLDECESGTILEEDDN